MTGYFVTGTDTGIGKTEVSLALLRGLHARGLTVAGMKPVATGAVRVEDGLRNDDAQRLLSASSLPLTYDQVNPCVYEVAASPHIAARLAGCPVDGDTIIRRVREMESLVDLVVVEGIGGWEVPLDDSCKLSDLAAEIGLPVILVVGMRLGCLNHAILTYEAVVKAGVECAGWIANQLDPSFDFIADNIDTLQKTLPCPYWGVLPFSATSGASTANEPIGILGNGLDIDEILRRFKG